MIRTFLAAAVIAVYGVGSFYIGSDYGGKTVQAQWATEKAVIAKVRRTIIAAQRAKEVELQANMDTLRKAYTDETAKLSRTVTALNDRMRNRPNRPTNPTAVPASASVGDDPRGCTGAELYRPDSEFLVGEFARAEEIRLALITCQKAYKSALMLCPATQEDASH